MTERSAGEAVLTVVGCGTLVPDGTRSSPAHHLETDAASVLLDCGPGTVHGLAGLGIDWTGLTHVAVTHFHNDHVGDLPALLIALKHGAVPPRTVPLTIVGPSGLVGLLDGMANALGTGLLDQVFPVDVIELEPPAEAARGVRPAAVGGVAEPFPAGALAPGLVMRSTRTPHTASSVAYVLEGAWGRLGYTGDTGPSSALERFLEGCSVLVAECAHPDGSETSTHLTPAALAELAAATRPDLLVVTHVYPPRTPETAARELRSMYSGRVVPGGDGLRIRIVSGDVTVDLPEGQG